MTGALTLHVWEILILWHLLFYQNYNFLSGIPSMSNSLDPDQTQHFARPDLGTNCLQCLSEENIKEIKILYHPSQEERFMAGADLEPYPVSAKCRQHEIYANRLGS